MNPGRCSTDGGSVNLNSEKRGSFSLPEDVDEQNSTIKLVQ